MTRVIILKKNIDNDLWPKLVFTMTYLKNNWLTRAVQNFSSYETYTYKLFNLFYLQILGFIIYVFLHKEKQTLKLEKWAPEALKRTLIGYNSHIIY